MQQDTERIAVSPVGKPGRAWLELRGSILIYRRESWVTSASLFIPVEWVSVSEKRRRDLRRLWHGILGLMAAVLFTLPLTLLVYRMRPHEPVDLWIGLGLGLLLAVALVSGLWSLARFPRREPVTVLRIANDAYPLDIAFWRHPGASPALDGLVAALREQTRVPADRMPFPVRMNHLWRRPRPFRIALVRGLAISFVLYVALLFLESLRLAGVGPEFSRALYLLLLLPPPVHLLGAIARRGARLKEPAAFRAALRAYQRGDLSAPLRRLEELLEAHPAHSPGRILMVQACAEACRFDEGMSHCALLAHEHPELATRLQASLWGLKRMHERMGP